MIKHIKTLFKIEVLWFLPVFNKFRIGSNLGRMQVARRQLYTCYVCDQGFVPFIPHKPY